jgi:lipoprotein-releasing system permease protein
VISEKIRGISAPITITSPGSQLNEPHIAGVLTQEFAAEICGISGSSTKQIIVDHAKQQTVVFVRGINPADEATVTSLPHKIIDPCIPSPAATAEHFSQLLPPGHMIVGYKLARMLRLSIGSTLTVLIPEPRSKKNLSLVSKHVIISGFFNVGLEEYDSNMAYVNMATLNKWFDGQDDSVEQITVALHSNAPVAQQHCLSRLRERFPELHVVSWQEQYPALVESLKLEKYMTFLVLLLITLVACMNMISLLFMQIAHKRRDIALLSTLGMPRKSLWALFLWMGMLITMSASLSGLGIAAGIGYLLKHVWQIAIPDVYFVSYLPVHMDLWLFVLVFACTMLLGLLATWLPLRNVGSIRIVEVLRNN